MEKNIFENAYFGKAYKTRDGRKVIYLRRFVCNGYNYCVSTGELEYSVKEDGKVDKNLYPYAEDITSEWEEPINEEKLDDLVLKYTTKISLLDKIKNFIIKHLKMVLKAAKRGE